MESLPKKRREIDIFCTGGNEMEQIMGTLFSDPQDQRPACFCPRCGGERYAPSLVCSRCERDRP